MKNPKKNISNMGDQDPNVQPQGCGAFIENRPNIILLVNKNMYPNKISRIIIDHENRLLGFLSSG
jgi:hypothetical protein